MVRKKQPTASQFRMYRHFAAITVVLTAAVAMLSDGERRDAMAQEIEARQQRNALEKASHEKFGKPKLLTRSAKVSGSFGPDSGSFGEPMDGAGSAGSGYIPDDLSVSGQFSAAANTRFGLTEAQWAALSQEQREELRRRAREEAARAASPERRNQIESLREASARRAGAASPVD